MIQIIADNDFLLITTDQLLLKFRSITRT